MYGIFNCQYLQGDKKIFMNNEGAILTKCTFGQPSILSFLFYLKCLTCKLCLILSPTGRVILNKVGQLLLKC